MSNLSQFMSGVKSIQRGTSAAGTVTISTVNMAKTVLRYCGSSDSALGSAALRIALASSTTISVIGGPDPTTGATPTASWEAVEYI